MTTGGDRVVVVAGLYDSGSGAGAVLDLDYGRHKHLQLHGDTATLGLLQTHFACGGDEQRTKAAWTTLAPQNTVITKTLAGPYLQQLLQDNGHEAVLVENYFPSEIPKLDAYLKSGQYPTVVVSTSFFYLTSQLRAVLTHIRQTLPRAFIIVGGMLIWKTYKCLLAISETDEYCAETCKAIREREPTSRMYAPLLDDGTRRLADAFIVNKQGETALLSLLKARTEGRDWRNLDSIAYSTEDDTLHINKVVEEPYHSPSCDWLRCTHPGATPFEGFYPVYAGQGCNFACAFCDYCVVFPQVRLDSPERIVEKVATVPLVNGFRRVYFTNDNIFQTKNQGMQICKALAEADLKLQWMAETFGVPSPPQ
eukprot:TRINITY_DN4447_c0_g2_i2.p1 TRINITY_DN4447_c0_g2~~TRINITY_DN4447_c0_g2_i2.p1  ORF type:complete len:366 (+),score=74.67 TRINITY_DN4447_c0_g2_i2:47-1144(+)